MTGAQSQVAGLVGLCDCMYARQTAPAIACLIDDENNEFKLSLCVAWNLLYVVWVVLF